MENERYCFVTDDSCDWWMIPVSMLMQWKDLQFVAQGETDNDVEFTRKTYELFEQYRADGNGPAAYTFEKPELR